MRTFGDQLTKHRVSTWEHLEAETEIPVLATLQRQGDVLIEPVDSAPRGEKVSKSGVAVVRGETSTGANSHILDGSPDAYWKPVGDEGVILGWLVVPEGSVAYLTHTDEHGCNGIAAGSYVLRGKREQADEIRRAAD